MPVDAAPFCPHAHGRSAEEVLRLLDGTPAGLSGSDAQLRLARFGPNRLPEPAPASPILTFLSQFRSPLIYILLLAAAVSLTMGDYSDAGFIFVVLLINALIGGYQEFTAQRSARALRSLVSPQARAVRDGEVTDLGAAALVPGDIVLLESGVKIPADLRLLESLNLSVDESLLTGESLPVEKNAVRVLEPEAALGDRVNMAFAGTLAAKGRGRGVVVATGSATELGKIAASVLGQTASRPPLLVRLERFTRRISIATAIAAVLLVGVSALRGMAPEQVFMLIVALFVSVIPEGLPVAITVALAVTTSRMAHRNVIVRRLVAIEALGSCTCIATDKTGTLTVNQLTARRIQLPDGLQLELTGEGIEPEGEVEAMDIPDLPLPQSRLIRLARAAALANEGVLARHGDSWSGHGDATDVALLVMAHKIGLSQPEAQAAAPQIGMIPYESEHRYAASLNRSAGAQLILVKGAFETVLDMCTSMDSMDGPVALDLQNVHHQAQALSMAGYRVLALAEGIRPIDEKDALAPEHLQDLTLLGLVGMADPPRKEAADAVSACRRAGIRVVMVTGDHPATALATARAIGLAERNEETTTGAELNVALLEGDAAFDSLCARSLVFSRVDSHQKLQIVESLQRSGHFVAVTGDGVNDAPALRAAQVGVAMGKNGTDVARETADLIITDDNFASIVAGVEEGRIAYGNIRKVIALLISTGAAELTLFLLCLIAGLPFPLLAVQLLWLNLVTNGIQDVALAFEPAEGGELARPTRPPHEAIFNRIMVERVTVSALLIGGVAFGEYLWLLARHFDQHEANNIILLLMVLFENILALNSRSETLSLFRHRLLGNKLLVFGTLAAQAIHIAAMHTPGISTVLHLQPVPFSIWLEMLLLSLLLMAAIEAHKAFRRRHPPEQGV